MLRIKFVDKEGETYYGTYFAVDFDHLFPDRFSGAYNFYRNEICVCRQRNFIITFIILLHELGHYILYKKLKITNIDSHSKYEMIWIKIYRSLRLLPKQLMKVKEL